MWACAACGDAAQELIPEFFYLSDFLENSNSFDMGAKQSGETVGAVELPPWANGAWWCPCSVLTLTCTRAPFDAHSS